MTSLKELKAKGALISGAPVPADIEWTHVGEDGQEVTDKFKVFVIRQSFGVIDRIFSGENDRSRSAKFISECIRLGEKANEQISYDDAFQLDPGLAAAFVDAINRVNGTAKGGEPKN